MLPRRVPVLSRPPVVLRAFRDSDAGLVQSVATDPLIPLVTSVPVTGGRADALAFIGRQHQRLSAGQGYSFAITEAASGTAVGQAGLWLRDADLGRASVGYWIAAPRRRGYTTAALDAISRWGLTLTASTGSSCTSNRGTRIRRSRSGPAATARACPPLAVRRPGAPRHAHVQLLPQDLPQKRIRHQLNRAPRRHQHRGWAYTARCSPGKPCVAYQYGPDPAALPPFTITRRAGSAAKSG
jgi:hypothetical protein